MLNALDIDRLLTLLRERGWLEKDGWIYAPKGTMWLRCSEPWGADLEDFFERMQGRRDRILRARALDLHPGFDDALSDVEILVSVLQVMIAEKV